ncbi:MAG TPA: hypothetical protein VF898_06395 [Chloroflexota bacterium]
MRRIVISLCLLGLVGCSSSRPYTALDLAQVKAGYHSLLPVYLHYRKAFFAHDFAVMQQEFAAEQVICKTQIDPVDRRDTIDPNTNLFQASGDLDNMCNDVESTYAGYRKLHHMSYDKTINPSFPPESFSGSDKELAAIKKYFKHPSALS